MILFLFLPLELLLGPDHNLKSYSGILHFQTTKSHNFPITRNPYYFFFLFSSIQGPTTQIGLLAYNILNSKSECFTTLHLSYLGVTTKMRTSFLESGQFYKRPQASLPGTNKAKLASSTHTNHQKQEMALKDPEARLAAELVLRCRRLQEQFSGTPALAMSRKRAQSGCRLWPHQLLDGSQLALTKQKQQANQRPDARYVSCKTTVLRRNIRSIGSFSKVSRLTNIGATRKKLAKIKFCCTSIYVHHWKHVLNGLFKGTSPKGQFRHAPNLHRSEKSQLNTIVT